jgi:hypothetical protein
MALVESLSRSQFLPEHDCAAKSEAKARGHAFQKAGTGRDLLNAPTQHMARNFIGAKS